MGCENLQSITVDANNSAYKSVNGMLLSKDGSTLVIGVGGHNLTIPSSVLTISAGAFYQLGLSGRLTLPNNV